MDARQIARSLIDAEPAERDRILGDLYAMAPDVTGLEPSMEVMNRLDRYLGALGAVRSRLRRYEADDDLQSEVESEMVRWQDQRDVVMLHLVKSASEPRQRSLVEQRGAEFAVDPGEVALLLVELGDRLGLDAQLGADNPDQRLDVCWRWSPGRMIPGLTEPLPLVGFVQVAATSGPEAVKAGVLDLLDAGCSLGVLVDQGDSARLPGTQVGTEGPRAIQRLTDERRRVVRALGDRPGRAIQVWTLTDLGAIELATR